VGDDDGGGNDGDDDGGGVDDGGDDEFVLMMVMLMVMTVLVQGSSNGEPRNPHPCTTLKLKAGSLLVRLCLPRAVVGSRVLRRSTFWSEKGSRRGLHLAPTHPHRAHTGQCKKRGHANCQEQGMLLASPASHKDTLKSEHAEDSAPKAAGAFAALAHTDAPTLTKAAVRASSGMCLEEPYC
jgi:hypothetical protein